ncbi:hypothetical protein [Aneurinibacillus terranovensis]|uniref:hypothetical protein n=1 Tax=Aneurinibacillus terranovensis TaxID=278991 RepID=UPI0004153350|nr:hypothetical protein [Aneurinibacillus terranovensis]
MKLSETLGIVDIKQLNQLASTYRCECNLNSKHELIQSLFVKLTRRSFYGEQFQRLSPKEKRFLLQLISDPKSTYSKSALYVKARCACERGQTDRTLIDQALANGWLYRVNLQTESYVFPEDVRAGWRRCLLEQGREAVEPMPDAPELYRDDTFILAGDLYILLTHLKENSLPLSKTGTLYRNHLVNIMKRFAVQEALPEKHEWRFGYGRRFRDYPDRFGLLYDFAYQQDLIEENAVLGLILTEKGSMSIHPDKWNVQEVAQSLVTYWRKTFGKSISALDGLCILTGGICTEWTDEKMLADYLSDWVTSFYYDTPVEIIKRRVLGMMVHTGLLRKGVSGESNTVYRFTVWGKSILSKLLNC